MNSIITKEKLLRIYDILVEHCGASPKDSDVNEFIELHLSNDYPVELHICPKLGVGGKLKRSGNNIWVYHYAETSTPTSILLEAKVNKLIKDVLYGIKIIIIDTHTLRGYRTEDSGQAMIMDIVPDGDDMKCPDDDNPNEDSLFVRLQSWDADKQHTEFKSLIGKKIKITIETID